MADTNLHPDPVAPHVKRGIAEMLPRRSAKLIAGLVLTLGIVAFAIVAPFFVQDPRYTKNPTLQPPSADHLLGTTKLGNDVLAQLAHGAKGSLTVGLIAGVIALTMSLIFGIVAGYAGGWTDEALSLVTNIMLVIPGLPLMIVIATYLQDRSMWIVALILGLTGWAGSAVVLRSQAKSLRNRDYVAASRVAGEGPLRIITVEILPNLLPLLAAQFLFGVIFAILGEASLSFLGLGPNGQITWGTMLMDSYGGGALAAKAWWWFIPPGLLIALFGCGLSLINFSIDEIINPKLRNAPTAAKSVRKARKRGLEIESSTAVSLDDSDDPRKKVEA
jgi:peptide/nickel transport system permease protein